LRDLQIASILDRCPGSEVRPIRQWLPSELRIRKTPETIIPVWFRFRNSLACLQQDEGNF
jgi:hypothetical protein